MRALALLFLILAAVFAAPLARAQTPVATSSPAGAPAAQAAPHPALTPDQAQGVLDVLQDDKKRQALVAVLQNMAHALPAVPAPAGKPGIVEVAPNSVGAQLVLQVSRGVEQIASQFGAAIDAVNDAPLLWAWAVGFAEDPTARGRALDSLWRLAVVLACAGAAEWLLIGLLARPQRALEAHAPADEPDTHDIREPGPRQSGESGPPLPGLPPLGPLETGAASEALDTSTPDGGPDTLPETAEEHAELTAQARGHRFSMAWKMLRRLPYVAIDLVLNLLPVAVFAGLGNALLGTPLGNTQNTRLVVIAVVNAYVVCRAVMCLTRTIVAPDAPRLRLVQCTDDTAAYVERWMRRLAVVAVFGFAAAEVGLLFGLYNSAHDVLLKLVGLVVHGMLIVIVLQKRRAVEHRLRARRATRGVVATFQNQFARQWHIVAIFYIVALWLVAAAEIKDGYTKLLHFFLVTSGVIAVARLAGIVMLGGLDRGLHAMRQTAPALEPRINRYYPVLRATLTALLFAATVVVLLQLWGLDPLEWFAAGKLGDQVLSALLTSAVTVALAATIWEAANVSIENHLAGLTRQAQLARATRLRTLLPMLRTALFVTILIIAGLIVMSQVGVNIAPLLAGAGVLGVALGFGSQKLVQDLITGLFLLLENTMQVGDVVTLASLTGTVEYLSIRTIRLRALDGSLHIIPFSSVTTVTNQTRDFSYALVDLEVGLNEEPDHVAEVLRDLVRMMRAEPRWQDAITADLDVMGVNAFGDNAWTLRLRIRTTPSQRWAVNREFNRRVKYRFDELGIQSPMTAWRAQGWLPPGAERPIAPPEPPAPPPPSVKAAPPADTAAAVEHPSGAVHDSEIAHPEIAHQKAAQ